MDAHDEQQRRLTAAALFERGQMSDARIGEMPGVTARAVDNRRRAWCRGGTDALMSKGRTGPKDHLDPDQRLRSCQILRRGAKDHGFTTDAWTLNRVRRVIAEAFGRTRGGGHRRVDRADLATDRKRGCRDRGPDPLRRQGRAG